MSRSGLGTDRVCAFRLRVKLRRTAAALAETVRRTRTACSIGVLTVLVWASLASAQSAENVLVVANAASAASLEIADYYATTRSIPPGQVLRLTMPVAEEVTLPSYANAIERPIADWIQTHGAQDRILYIVLTKHVPLRIAGTQGKTGTTASVDSELTLLYRKLTGSLVPLNGFVPNPYFLGETSVSSAKPFTHRDHDIYLVSRLDGFTVEDVKTLIDRGVKPAREGMIALAPRVDAGGAVGNTWLDRSATRVRETPGWKDAVVHESIVGLTRTDRPALGYYSWGSNDPATSVIAEPRIRFAPGALAGMFLSLDARTFAEPPAEWRAGKPFAGSTQSLTGTLIREGVTGIAGHVSEPFLNAAIRPDILFPSYLRGFNLVEAFYLAMPFLSWQTVVVGDPLCAPFREQAIAASEIEAGTDPVSGLPRFFSDRRITLLARSGVKRDAAGFFLKAQQQLTHKDLSGAQQALERATSADPVFVDGQMSLAALYEHTGQFDSAVERYERILALNPKNAIALNNLAYLLAVQKNAPAKALPLALQAYAMAPKVATIADTLGWVHHLLGDNAKAEPLLAEAASDQHANIEMLVHAATVFAATGQRERALQSLERAAAAGPGARDQARIQQLRLSLQ